MINQRNVVMDIVFPDWRDKPPPTLIKEERMWYRDSRFSGKADFIAADGKDALIVDYKCGRIPVTAASDNGQMRWNVALLDCKYKFDTVTVALIQPRCGAPSIHTYDREGVKKCRSKVVSTLRKMEAINPPLKAGEKQCKYCKAKGFCPELAKKQEVISRVGDAGTLTTRQLTELLAIVPAVEAKCKQIKSRAKELLLDNPDSIDGWKLSTPSATRLIADPSSALQKMEEESLINPEGFLASCSVSIGKLQREVVEHTGMGPSEARRTINTVLGSSIVEKLREPSIKKEG